MSGDLLKCHQWCITDPLALITGSAKMIDDVENRLGKTFRRNGFTGEGAGSQTLMWWL